MDRYLVTGATGLIGSMAAKRIISCKEKVDVIVRNPSDLDIEISSNAGIKQADITDCDAISCISEKYDYIIHCAAPTQSGYMVSHPVEVIKAIVNGTEHILDMARRCDAKSVVYLSSMEVYGQISCPDGKRITEDQGGYIDVANVRSCYPIAKIMAENLCHSYYKEYGVPVKIARLAQTFGKGVRLTDGRVYMQFARAAVEKRDIVLHTQGLSMGNYCASEDVVNAIFTLLKKGGNGEAYNVVNEDSTMRIRDMADLVARKLADGQIKVKVESQGPDGLAYAPDTGLRLSSEKLRQLGWKPEKGLEEMYRDVMEEIKEAAK